MISKKSELKCSDGSPALCDVSKCRVVKIKGLQCGPKGKGEVERIKSIAVAPNMRSGLLVFKAESGPDKNLVIGCADGWSFLSAE